MAELSSDPDLQLGLIHDILHIARANLDENAVLQACTVLQTLSISIAGHKLPLDSFQEIEDLDIPGFIREVLSDPFISNNSVMVQALYFTLHNVLRLSLPQGQIYSTDYITFLVTCIVRDTALFIDLAEVIMSCMCAYISGMQENEMISVLRDLGVHATVAGLLCNCSESESIHKAMRLLACIVLKYDDHLEDVHPFFEVGVPLMVIEKAKISNHDNDFANSFNIVMLSLTSRKGATLEVFKTGVLEQNLLPLVCDDNMVNLWDTVVNTIGNMVLVGHQVIRLLLDRRFHITLVSLVLQSGTLGKSQSLLVSACVRVLGFLASEYPVKKELIEYGLIEALLDILLTNVDASWTWVVLKFLQFLIDAVSPQVLYSSTLLEIILRILSSTKDSKIVYYITDIMGSVCQLNPGARKLREMGASKILRTALSDPLHCETYSHLNNLGSELFESVNLYTISSHQSSGLVSCQTSHPSDWPPIVEVKEGEDSQYSSPVQSFVLPADDACYSACIPTAPPVAEQITGLGLDSSKPIFHVGRFYGNDVWPCKACGEGFTEMLLFQPLSLTCEQYQSLVDLGWHRRGGVRMYRLRRIHQLKCSYWETRVIAKNFDPNSHKSYKKVLRRMPLSRLTVETRRSHFNRQAFDLYNVFHKERFDVVADSEYYYWTHVVNTPIPYQVIGGVECGTFHVMYWLDGKLVAVEVVDIIPKGIVSVYMWYDVSRDVSKYSFGVYSILRGIEKVRSMSEKHPKMAYYYLQGWNADHKGLGYKSDYQPEEFYCPCLVDDWVLGLEEVNKFISKRADQLGTNQENIDCGDEDHVLQKCNSSDKTDGDNTGIEPLQNTSASLVDDSCPNSKEQFPGNDSSQVVNESFRSIRGQSIENNSDTSIHSVNEVFRSNEDQLEEKISDISTRQVNEVFPNKDQEKQSFFSDILPGDKEQLEEKESDISTKIFPSDKEQLKEKEADFGTAVFLKDKEQLKENESDISTHPVNGVFPDKEENKSDSSPPHLGCDSFSIDLKRYTEVTGTSVDVSKVVVCLNYIDFIHLDDLFKLHITDDKQKHIIESRVKELYVSLPLELRAQLVIDMAAC